MNKIKMDTEKQRYTVQAHDDRFFVCTKPFNAQKTFLYFVADMKSGKRGPSNWSYGLPFTEKINTPEGAEKLLEMFRSGEAVHSMRNRPMNITETEMAQFTQAAKEQPHANT